jgi:hypothetical protein
MKATVLAACHVLDQIPLDLLAYAEIDSGSECRLFMPHSLTGNDNTIDHITLAHQAEDREENFPQFCKPKSFPLFVLWQHYLLRKHMFGGFEVKVRVQQSPKVTYTPILKAKGYSKIAHIWKNATESYIETLVHKPHGKYFYYTGKDKNAHCLLLRQSGPEKASMSSSSCMAWAAWPHACPTVQHNELSLVEFDLGPLPDLQCVGPLCPGPSTACQNRLCAVSVYISRENVTSHELYWLFRGLIRMLPSLQELVGSEGLLIQTLARLKHNLTDMTTVCLAHHNVQIPSRLLPGCNDKR